VKLAETYFGEHRKERSFIAGEICIRSSGQVLDSTDCAQVIHTSLDM
jgi:hypothetical protein